MRLPSSRLWVRLRHSAHHLKRDLGAVSLAARDPRVPWYAKVLALLVAAYAVSPIDLIPDCIPLLGYLDDMLLVPLGIWLVIRLIPQDLMAEFRAVAAQDERAPTSWTTAVVIVVVWLIALGLLAWWSVSVLDPWRTA
jgi:uncharacterized membrane protein YkvA (DUF1232 family)